MGYVSECREQLAVEVIPNLEEIGVSNLKTDNKEARKDYAEPIKSTIKKDSIEILSRVDVAQTIKPQAEATEQACHL